MQGVCGKNASAIGRQAQVRGVLTRTHLICHRDVRSDLATSMRLDVRRLTAVATATRLPRYARNDRVGTQVRGVCSARCLFGVRTG